MLSYDACVSDGSFGDEASFCSKEKENASLENGASPEVRKVRDRSFSCGKVRGERYQSSTFDDCAMRPLKLFAEENRRKSAPTFHQNTLGESKHLIVNDGFGDILHPHPSAESPDDETTITKLDGESTPSFSSFGMSKEGEEDYVDSAVESRRHSGGNEHHSGNMGRLKSGDMLRGSEQFRMGRRVGCWQGKVQFALRRSVALDTTISPAKERKSPRVLARNHRLHQSMANALQRSKDLGRLSELTFHSSTPLRCTKGNDFRQQSYADTVLQEKYKKALHEKENQKVLLSSHQDEIQELKLKIGHLRLLIQDREEDNAKKVGEIQSDHVQKKLEISKRDAKIGDLEAQVSTMQKMLDDAQQSTGASASKAITCATALMCKVDSLVQEKEELKILVCNLWSRIQDPKKHVPASNTTSFES